MMNDRQASGRSAGGIVTAGQGRQSEARTRPTVKVGPHGGSRLIGVLESEIPPGAAFPDTSHEDYEEVFYVLAGEIEYLIDECGLPRRLDQPSSSRPAGCTASATTAPSGPGAWPSPAPPRR